MTSGRRRGGAAAGQALLLLMLVAPGAGGQATPPRAQAPPGWLDEAPTSRVETMHVVAVADPITVPLPADGRLTLTLRLTPRPGMRVYAHDVTGYVPFTVRLDAVAGVTVEPPVYPASTWYEFPPTRERSRVYQTTVTVTQPLLLSAAARVRLEAGAPQAWTATLRYQACDDRLCYRPTEARIAWPLALR